MSKISSKVEICNLALTHLKAGRVTDIDNPTTEEEQLCNLWYDQTRLEMLRTHSWNFAQKRIKLPVENATPAFEYTSQYLLPSDFVRLLAVGKFMDIVHYQMEDHRILLSGTSQESSQNTQQLPILYTYDHQQPSLYDSLFISILALKLALNMSYALTGSNGAVQRIERLLSRFDSEAKAVDGQERPPERIEKSKYLGSRKGNIGSTFRDRPDLVIFDD